MLMAFDPHQRARFLIDGARIAGIAPEDVLWLRSHVAGCVECALYEQEINGIVRGLKAFAFDADPAMSERIQIAVAARLRRPLAVRWWPAAAVVFLVVAGAPIYEGFRNDRREKADSFLMESVENRVGRVVPTAMEPLIQSQPEESR
jgi:hypothetical protein